MVFIGNKFKNNLWPKCFFHKRTVSFSSYVVNNQWWASLGIHAYNSQVTCSESRDVACSCPSWRSRVISCYGIEFLLLLLLFRGTDHIRYLCNGDVHVSPWRSLLLWLWKRQFSYDCLFRVLYLDWARGSIMSLT